GEKRIRIVPIRDLEAKQFGDALQTGLEKNHDAAALAALKPATDALLGALAAVGEVKAGTEIVLDRLGNGATRLLVDTKQQGEDIADAAFYPALLRIWLGERPADSELREALLKNPQ
ncbi:MAG TPA: chalcone isomerase family protein, partial [Thauera aminoaromatica]|nr:chalcone isomerase family protein [Thauera aminoaromatica]HNC67953.1 chalcone isomerase family protein [Thauera aminoaromatica]HND59559.1 chalcone isomerase family protein [Thauera aminoaromatica]